MSSLLLPFQVGGHRVQSSSGELDQRRQDGFVASIIAFLFLLGLGFTLSLAHLISQHQSVAISSQAVEVCLMVYMITASAIMLRYLLFSSKVILEELKVEDKVEDKVITTRNHSVKKYVRTKLVVIGLIVFYLFGMFVDGFKIMAQIDCMGSFSKCGWLNKIVISTLFCAIRITFMGVVVLFGVHFDQKTFVRKVSTHYCIMLIGVSVLTIWFDSVVNEYRLILETPGSIPMDTLSCPQFNLTSLTNTSKIYMCLTKTTDLYELSLSASHFLYSFNVEFTLLATKIIGNLFLDMKTLPEPGLFSPPLQEGSEPRLTAVYTLQELPVSSTEPPSPLALEDPAESESSLSDTYSTTTESTTANIISNQETGVLEIQVPIGACYKCQMKPVAVPIALVMCVLLTLLFIVFSILSYYGWIIPYFIVEIAYWVPMIACSVVGYWAARTFVSDYKPYSGLEFLMLVCTMGIFCYDLYSFYSIFATFAGTESLLNPDKESCLPLTIISLIEKLCNVIEAYLQASFMLYARRVRFDPELTPNKQKSFQVFRACLVYLAFSNLVMWGNDTFVKVKNPGVEQVMAYYYGSQYWTLIIHLTFPFALFFRFNSFLLLLQTVLTQ